MQRPVGYNRRMKMISASRRSGSQHPFIMITTSAASFQQTSAHSGSRATHSETTNSFVTGNTRKSVVIE